MNKFTTIISAIALASAFAFAQEEPVVPATEAAPVADAAPAAPQKGMRKHIRKSWKEMTPEEKEEAKQKMAEFKAKWDALSPEEKEKIIAERKACFEKMKAERQNGCEGKQPCGKAGRGKGMHKGRNCPPPAGKCPEGKDCGECPPPPPAGKCHKGECNGNPEGKCEGKCPEGKPEGKCTRGPKGKRDGKPMGPRHKGPRKCMKKGPGEGAPVEEVPEAPEAPEAPEVPEAPEAE